MADVVKRYDRFVILDTERHFVVVNTKLKPDKDHPNGYHSHFKYLDVAEVCLKLIKRGLRPKSPRMRESVERLVTQDEFRSMRISEPKQKPKKRRRH